MKIRSAGMHTDTPYRRNAVLIAGAIAIVFFACLVYIIYAQRAAASDGRIADIYSDGTLIRSIDLRSEAGGSFIIGDEQGSFNEISVNESGDICVSRASCPDKLCVHQGFARNASDIPIVCLPNRLVIIIRNSDTTKYDTKVPDGVTYD